MQSTGERYHTSLASLFFFWLFLFWLLPGATLAPAGEGEEATGVRGVPLALVLVPPRRASNGVRARALAPGLASRLLLRLGLRCGWSTSARPSASAPAPSRRAAEGQGG